MITRARLAVSLIALCLGFLGPVGQAQAQTGQYSQNRILVKPAGPSGPSISALHAQLGTTVLRSYPRIGNIQVVQLPAGLTVPQAITAFQNSGLVRYAEPDYIVQATQVYPNDPKFTDGTLWGLHNTGQNGGTADADIDAPEGWARRNTANQAAARAAPVNSRSTRFPAPRIALPWMASTARMAPSSLPCRPVRLRNPQACGSP